MSYLNQPLKEIFLAIKCLGKLRFRSKTPVIVIILLCLGFYLRKSDNKIFEVGIKTDHLIIKNCNVQSGYPLVHKTKLQIKVHIIEIIFDNANNSTYI